MNEILTGELGDFEVVFVYGGKCRLTGLAHRFHSAKYFEPNNSPTPPKPCSMVLSTKGLAWLFSFYLRSKSESIQQIPFS